MPVRFFYSNFAAYCISYKHHPFILLLFIMKKLFFTRASLLTTAVCAVLFVSCKSDVNVNDIDPGAEIEANVALPVGKISTTIKDYMGKLHFNDNAYIEANETAKEAGRLEFKFHTTNKQPFTNFGADFAGTLGATGGPATLPIGAALAAEGKSTLPSPYTAPLPVKFTGINNPDFFKSTGRIDSMLIANADLELTVSFTGTLAAEQSKISQIQLTSPNINFGQPVYFSASDGTLKFNETMKEHIIHQFSLCLMKDKKYLETQSNPTLAECEENVTDQITVNAVISTSPGETINVGAADGMQVSFNFKVNRYYAIWGWFNVNNKLRDKSIIDLNKEMPGKDDEIGWKDIKAANLPLAEPRIDIKVKTEVAAPLNLNVQEVSVTARNDDGTAKDTRKAHFEDPETGEIVTYLKWPVIPDEQLENFKTEAYNTQHTNTLNLTHEKKKGDLANLFRARPDEIAYQFDVEMRKGKYYLQQRVTDRDTVDLDIDITLPFIFNQGLDLQSPDFEFDADLSDLKMKMDSLDIEMENLKLILDVANTIPLAVKVGVTFMKEDGSAVDIKINETGSDTIYVAAATAVDENGVTLKDQPTKSLASISLKAEDFEKFADVKKMKIAATIQTDKALKEGDRVVVTQYDGLSITLKASASLKKLLNLKEIEEDKK